MKGLLLLLCLANALLMVGCATEEKLNYYNSDNDCVGNVERDYSVTWDGDSGEIKQQKQETCRPEVFDPVNEQRTPSEKALDDH
mgnify:CR=1 FL=1